MYVNGRQLLQSQDDERQPQKVETTRGSRRDSLGNQDVLGRCASARCERWPSRSPESIAQGEYPSAYVAIHTIAGQLGIGSAEALRKWVQQVEFVAGGDCHRGLAEIGQPKK